MTDEQREDLHVETKMLLEQCRANMDALVSTAAGEQWPIRFVYRGIAQLLSKTIEMVNGLDDMKGADQ